jgi:hypothetical protein
MIFHNQLLNTLKMLGRFEKISTLASQKKDLGHTNNHKITFFTRNSATKQLRIYQFF